MSRGVALISGIFILLSVVPVFSQSGHRDPSAVGAITKMASAMRLADMALVRDILAQYSVRAIKGNTSTEYTATLKTLGRKMWRTEAEGQDGPVVTIFNGLRMRRTHGKGKREDMPSAVLAEAGNWLIPSLSIVGDWENPSTSLKDRGRGNNGGVHHIQLRRGDVEKG